MRITRKLLIPTLTLFGLVIVGLILYNTIISVQRFETNEQRRLENMQIVFQSEIRAKEELAVALAMEVANNLEIQAVFAAQERERLIELTLPAYEALDARFDIPQYQFHVPPATSFLRLHNLESFGDDLSDFRATVVLANAEQRTIAGPEIGRGGLGVRGVVPVSYQGNHVGTVEFGTNIDFFLINALKDEFGYEWQILLSRGPAEVATFEGATSDVTGPTDDLLLQASTLETPVFASAEHYIEVINGNGSVEQVSVGDLEYGVFSAPILDFSGNVIGVLDIMSDYTPIIQQQNNQLLLSVVFLIGILLFVSLVFSWLAGRTLNPIGELTTVATHLAAGDFTQRMTIRSRDEVGVLAQAFNTMAEQLQGFFGALEQQVVARTKALDTSIEVSHYLSTILDPEQLVFEVVNQVKDAFDYYHVHIYLLDSNGQALRLVGGTGEAGRQMLERGHSIPLERGLVGRAARTNKAVLIPDTLHDEGWLSNPHLPETRAEVAVPIRMGDMVLGVLDVQQNVVNGLTQDDVNLLQSIANQVAVAIRNARQYTQTQESEARLRAMIEAIPTAVMITRVADGVVLYANENAAALFGYPRHELIGNATPNLYYHLSDRETILGILARDGRLPNYEVLGRRKDDTPVWVALSVQKMEYAGESAFYINATDITVQRQASEALLKRAERDRVLNRISTKIRGAVSMEQILQVAVQEVRQVTGASRGVVKIDPQEKSGSVESITHSVGAMERSE